MIKAETKTIEADLRAILEQIHSQTWTVKDLFQALKGKGYPLLIILLSLPFCQPLQVPGFSTPFGIAIIFVGLRMAFGHRVWWPSWILKQKISPQLLKVVIQKSLGFFRFLSPLLHTRWSWMVKHSVFYYFHGGFVALMGGYLALPLPIPMSNFLSAWPLLFVGLGLLKEDGLFLAVGYSLGIVALSLLGYLIWWLHAWTGA